MKKIIRFKFKDNLLFSFSFFFFKKKGEDLKEKTKLYIERTKKSALF